MKNYILIIFIFTCVSLSAQTYHPFPTKNTLWTEMYYNPYPNDYAEFHCFALKDKDTIINTKLYHKLYHSKDTLFTEAKLCGGIREENKKVYFYPLDPSFYGYEGQAKEIILYDFSLKKGDIISPIDLFRISGELEVINVDSTLTEAGYRKSIKFGIVHGSPIPWAVWVEGIGSLRGLLFETGAVPTNGLFNDLICFRQDNVFLYHYDNNYTGQYHHTTYDACFYIYSDVIEMPTKDSKLSVFPNPVKTTTCIEVEKPTYSRLILSDLYGKTLMEYEMEGKTSIEVNRAGIPNGLYLITISDRQGNKQTAKVIFK